MDKENNKYEIRSFEQLCNVANDENVEMLATDCALWLIQYQKLISDVRKANPMACEGKSNYQIAEGGFNWINDGKNDQIGFKTTVKETGETRFYKFPNKD